jgi:hypothetical protein
MENARLRPWRIRINLARRSFSEGGENGERAKKKISAEADILSNIHEIIIKDRFMGLHFWIFLIGQVVFEIQKTFVSSRSKMKYDLLLFRA